MRREGGSGSSLLLYRSGSSSRKTVWSFMPRRLTIEGFVPLLRLSLFVTSFWVVLLSGGIVSTSNNYSYFVIKYDGIVFVSVVEKDLNVFNKKGCIC